MIDITINGTPKALKRHRVGKYGKMYDPNYKDKKNTMLKIAKFKPKHPLKGDIMLKLIFTMPYKKYHYRTGKFKYLLKDNVPEYVAKRPDLDNYCKYIMDVLQPGFYKDDSQVVKLQAEKVYGIKGETEIIIEEI